MQCYDSLAAKNRAGPALSNRGQVFAIFYGREARRVLRGSNGHTQQALYQIDQNNPQGLLETISKAIEKTSSQEKKAEMLTFKMQVQKHKEAAVDYRQRLKAQLRKYRLDTLS